ncbi:MAG: MotA/TolQ/ExbB proton channel family protein [Bdellovibrionota bacterium]
MSVWELVKTGGWTMIPLFVCSVAVWGVVVERFWTLRNWREKNREFLLSFSNLWLRGEKDGARKLSEKAGVELADLARELFNEPLTEKLVHRIERKRLEQAGELRRFLWVLGTIGTSAPFIGLFGTVVGIIKSFASIAEAGTGGFAVVAAGISEALVATAAGILVAVIAVFFYNYFQVRVGQYQFQLKLLTEEMIEVWDRKGAA